MSEKEQKYAYAEVIQGNEREQWMVPMYDGAGVRKINDPVPVSKESQAQNETTRSVKNWVEPRLRFKDMLAWLDLNIWHKRAVFLKAALTCGLGWHLDTDDEDKNPDSAYDAITEFLNKPNEDPTDSFTRQMFRATVDLEAIGNFILEFSRRGDGRAGHMYHQRAVNFRRDRNLRTGGYYQLPETGYGLKKIPFSNFGQKRGNQNEILHYYTYDPASDYYGMPIWVPSLADMVLDRSSVEFNINLFRNQLVAKFAVVVEGGKLSPEGRKSLREFLKSQATGPKNAGKTLILDTDDVNVKVKVEKLELEFGDKQNFMGKTRETSRDMVIAAHGLPPRILGVAESGQLGGGGELLGQLKLLGENEIGPTQSLIESFMDRTVLASFGEHKWKLKFNQIDHTDKKLDAEVEQILTGAGIKLKSESRQDLELPMMDEEDLPQGGTPANMMSLQKRLARIRKDLEDSGEY